MRIAIDARTLEADHSGVGTYVRELVGALARLQGDETYRLLVHRPELVSWADLPRCKPWTTRFSHESHPWGDLWENLWLPRRLARERIALFHGPAFLIPLVPIDTPLVVTIHDLVAFLQRHTVPRRYGRYMRWMTSWAARRARRIIVVSSSVRDELLEVLGVDPDLIRVVPLAVGNDFFRDGSDEEEERVREVALRYGLASDYILFVGNLEPRKNLPFLIRAFERVRERAGSELQLVLCGRWGWLYDTIRKALDASPARESILLTGYVPRADLPYIYRGARLFTFPSLSEGFGLPTLEAMASGVPVVATRTGAIPEVAGNAALLVPPNGQEELVEGILSILGDPDRAREMSARGRTHAERFTWETVARSTLDVYREVASG